jgi:hypothetical protein
MLFFVKPLDMTFKSTTIATNGTPFTEVLGFGSEILPVTRKFPPSFLPYLTSGGRAYLKNHGKFTRVQLPICHLMFYMFNIIINNFPSELFIN